MGRRDRLDDLAEHQLDVEVGGHEGRQGFGIGGESRHAGEIAIGDETNLQDNVAVSGKLVMLGDRVIVRRDPSEDKTPGGPYIPKTAEKESCLGRVVAAGPGKTTDQGTVLPMTVKAGDHVAFSKYGHTEVVLGGETLLIMHEGELLGVIEEVRAEPGTESSESTEPPQASN